MDKDEQRLFNERGERLDAYRNRIRELEAELQVRDNCANEVLRILREATGKRDFHSEMEAAEHAAKMLAEARLDSARLKTALRTAMLVLSGQETSKSMLIRALELCQLAMKEAK